MRPSAGVQQNDDRAPAHTHVRPGSDVDSPSHQSKTPLHKKYRSGIHDDRTRHQTHSRPESDVDSPVQPVNDSKRARGDVDVGMGEHEDKGDLKILSALLRGVGITELYSPQHVVEVCHKFNLVKGDSFDLRTGFDFSDPAVQGRVARRILETEAKLIISAHHAPNSLHFRR